MSIMQNVCVSNCLNCQMDESKYKKKMNCFVKFSVNDNDDDDVF